MPETINHKSFGLWKSPLTPKRMSGSLRFSDLGWDEAGNLVWSESRLGRDTLVVQPSDGQAPRDINNDYTVRAGVGYGGGDFSVSAGQVFFVDAETGGLFRQSLNQGQARAVTPAFGACAAPVLSPDENWLLYVHSYQNIDCLALTDVEGKFWPQRIVSGRDFYMQPVWRPNPSGGSLWIAWVQWSHPNMPWDGTELCMGRLETAEESLPVLAETRVVAGDVHTSIFQPEFSPDGKYLAYVSDISGWWQLYLYDLETGKTIQLTSASAEHAVPAWNQGQRTYQFAPDGENIYCLRNQAGRVTLWQIEIATVTERQVILDVSYGSLEQIAIRRGHDHPLEIALIASDDRIPPRIILCRPEQGITRVIRRSAAEDLPIETYSLSRPVQWTGMDGGVVYGLFYPPQNPGFRGNGLPPLIVKIHGGPTSQQRATFIPDDQFFTSRGYAVLEVNYRGSTGYGRAYAQALRANWGIFDVQDAVSGVNALVELGLVDRDKVIIKGGSSGGYTVLKALIDFPGFFKAGICLYGISNHFAISAETHKFEAHY
ncbi:MAG TPA: prolyl oligopeptidase family serine peptidase, partial [Anaerolineales bacterium]|nr:prolyl oligopeptidase family serine peptidase [Anaerolineales bacterium]